MKIKNLFLLAFGLAFSWAYCDDKTNHLITKMGFKAVCEFPFYDYGVSAEELEK